MTPPDLSRLLEQATWVRALARRLVGDDDRAADVAQDSWVVALDRPPRDAATIRLWWRSVVTRLAGRSARTAGRRERRERRVAREESLPSAAEVVARANTHRVVVEEVLALDEPYRSTILFHFFEGLTAEEIGFRAGVPAGTVRVRLHRALEKLRERLDARSGGDRTSWCFSLAALGGKVAMTTVKSKVAIGVSTAIVFAVLLGLSLRNRDRTIETVPEVAVTTPSERVSAQVPTVAPANRPPESDPVVPARSAPGLSGRVVDASGESVTGARVVAVADDAGFSVAPDSGVKTGRDGRFELPGLDPERLYALVADGEAQGTGSLESIRVGSDVVLTLSAPGAIQGFVRDMDGDPIAGARVAWRALVRGARIDRETVSSEDGAYLLEGLPASRPGGRDVNLAPHLAVAAAGFAPVFLAQHFDGNAPPERVVDVYLSPGGTVRGRVVDAEDESPIAGARVVLIEGEERVSVRTHDGQVFRNPFEPRRLNETVSGADGRFEFDAVPAVGVHKVGHPSDRDPQTLELGRVAAVRRGLVSAATPIGVPRPGGVIEIEVRCWPAATVTGRVVDPNGAPIAGATVASQNETCPGTNWYSDTTVVTDADGAYRLAMVPARRGSPSMARIFASVHYPLAGAGSWGSADVGVTAGESAEASEIVIQAPPTVVVRVVDRRGAPLGGAALRRDPRMGSAQGRTDANGRCAVRFHERDLRNGKPIPIYAVLDGFALGASELVMPSSNDPPEVVITLRTGGRISGRVVDEAGDPVTRGSVLVWVANDASMEALDWPVMSRAGHATPGHDGTFEVGHLPPGPYRVVASRSRHPEEGVDQAVLNDVPPGANDLLFVLPEESIHTRALRLEGTIRDAAAAEAVSQPKITLTTLRGDPRWRSGTLVAPGRFVIEGVYPGEYALEVRAPGFAGEVLRPIRVDGGKADRPLDVVLDREARIRGRVRGASGESIGPGRLVLRGGASGRSPEADVAADGSFEIGGLREGVRYAVEVVGHGGWSGRVGESIVASAEGSDSRAIEVVRAGELELHGLRWREGVRLEIVRQDGAVALDWRDLPEDLSRLRLPPGGYVVRRHLPEREVEEHPVSIALGPTARVIFSAD